MNKVDLTIVGSGVTGQATGIGFSKFGNNVTFYDIDSIKLALLKAKGYTVAESISSAIQRSDIIFVCVPTPTINGKMEFSIIQSALIAIGEALGKTRKYRLIVIRSTVLPSTTRSKIIPLLEKYSKLKVGRDFGVCMNPEFLREKTAFDDFLSPSRIVIGEFDEKSGDLLEKLYLPIKVPLIRTTLDSAEMIKYASNLFLATKISFFNEIFTVCQNMNVDANLVGKAVSLDPRIGEYGVYGGRHFDGKCLPKDLEAFKNFVKTLNIDPKLLDAVFAVNNAIQVKIELMQRR